MEVESQKINEVIAPKSAGCAVLSFSGMAFVGTFIGVLVGLSGGQYPESILAIVLLGASIYGLCFGSAIIKRGNCSVTLYSDRVEVTTLGRLAVIPLNEIASVNCPWWLKNENSCAQNSNEVRAELFFPRNFG